MSVLTNNQTILPFLAEHKSFNMGINPLGMQNATTDAYTALLPGLNNVTERIRYYSFYCWLFYNRFQKIDKTDKNKQRTFIRKAEYLIALINAISEKPGGVPGIDFAGKVIANNVQNINLREGIYNAEGTTIKTYWQNASGILGQYYAGALRTIAIVGFIEGDETLDVFNITKNKNYIDGQKLGIAFDKNVPADIKELFFNSIEEEEISRDNLLKLTPFFIMNKVPEDSEEQQLILDMLKQQDYPDRQNDTFFRKKTITYYLEYISTNPEKPSAQDFAQFMYEKFHNNPQARDSTLTGWYYYYVNEIWQYNSLIVFDSTLKILKDRYQLNPVNIEYFVSEITEEVLPLLAKNNDIRLYDYISQNDLTQVITDKQTNIDKIATSLNKIFELYSENYPYKQQLEEFKAIINSHNSDWIDFSNMLHKKREKTLKEYIYHFILNEIIYRHYMVAFTKMNSSNIATQKIIIENYNICYIDTFAPAHTSPRIRSVANFVEDLGLVESDKLTAKGQTYLNQLEND